MLYNNKNNLFGYNDVWSHPILQQNADHCLNTVIL